MNSTRQIVEFDYGPSSSNASSGGSVFGWYRGEYLYWAFLPEIRVLDDHLLYTNLGFAAYNNISTILYKNGGNTNIGEQFRGSSNAFIANIGINPTWKNMGFLINVGYHIIGATSLNPDYTPKIGFSQWNFKFGTSYRLK